MRFSKTFMTALAALPLVAPSEAEALQKCKTYTKQISTDGRRDFAYAKACRMDNGVWEIVKLTAKRHETRNILAEHIYDDLFDKGYDVLVDARYDRDRYHTGYHSVRYSADYPRYYYNPKRHKRAKHAHYRADKHCNKHH